MFRHDPNTLWPTSLYDWFVLLMLVTLFAALLLPGAAIALVYHLLQLFAVLFNPFVTGSRVGQVGPPP